MTDQALVGFDPQKNIGHPVGGFVGDGVWFGRGASRTGQASNCLIFILISPMIDIVQGHVFIYRFIR